MELGNLGRLSFDSSGRLHVRFRGPFTLNQLEVFLDQLKVFDTAGQLKTLDLREWVGFTDEMREALTDFMSKRRGRN